MQALVVHHARHSCIVTDVDRDAVLKLCSALANFCFERLQSFVLAAAGRPILWSYGSDGTPLTSQQVFTKSSGAMKVHRRGGSAKEWLCQILFLRVLSLDGTVGSTVPLLIEPWPVASKTGPGLFAVAQKSVPLLVELGHTGISIQHGVFDRAVFSVMKRQFEQYGEVRTSERAATMEDPVQAQLLPLLQWHVATSCGLHDGHNALKWAIHSEMNPDVLKEVYISLESARNSYSLSVEHMGAWLLDVISFREDTHNVDHLKQFWALMCLDAEVVEVLCDLQLLYRDGRLFISERHRVSLNLIEQVSTVLMHVWAFRRFSESRWLTVGCCNRTLAASEQLGLQSLVAFIRKRPHASDYYIGGLSRLSQAGQKFVTIASTASFVADAFIVEVADDDRVPLRRQHLVDTMEEEMDMLASIPLEVWSIMASPLVDVTGAALQSTILKAAHVSIAFISVRCLHPASRAPWHLCGGDLELNLEALRGQPQPSEPTTCKVWQLLQLGYNVPQLLLAVRSLQDCPWSTVHVEQGHAHASGVAKAHGQYGPDMLAMKACLSWNRLLFPSRNRDDEVHSRMEHRLQKLEAKRPNNLRADNLYFRDLSAQLELFKRRGRVVTSGVRAHIMRTHKTKFKHLPLCVCAKHTIIAWWRRSLLALSDWLTMLLTRGLLYFWWLSERSRTRKTNASPCDCRTVAFHQRRWRQ